MAIVPQKVQPYGRGDRSMFSSSDDNAMMKQIQATHSPDGREVDVKPLLQITEDIFKRASHGIPGILQVQTLSLVLYFMSKLVLCIYINFIWMFSFWRLGI